MQSNALNSTELDLAVNDLGPLAWVLDELRKSLDSAAKALKRFVREAEAARGSDLAALDASQLRIARQQLHQAVGALEMVGLAGPALVLRAMEAAVQRFVQQPEQCSQEAAAKIERASFALTEYLEGVLADKPISAVSLFPQYREVQELVRADRIHPADLWPYVFRWLDPELAVAAAPQNYDSDARAAFDQSVLQIMKGKSLQSAENLRALSLGFAARQADQQPRVFWKIAAAYFDALANDLLGSDLYVRRVASRVLLQYSALSKGDSSVSERLALDLLFFCSQAVPNSASQAPVLSAVRTAFGLVRFKPVNYEAIQFGRFDPALLAQARKRIVSAKESWSSLSAGDTNKFKLVGDQFGLVSDSLVKLHPPSEPLALALARSIDMTVRSGQPPAIELAMEVATSVLYLEAAFEDLDPSDPQLALRTHDLAVRLENVRGGGQPQPLQPWMEELYRRVSDKQTMGSVVGELRIALGELEKSLDLFFRNPREKAVLSSVPGQLSQMRGVLSVLGLDQASQAVLRMRESVEHMLETEVDEHLARAAGTFDQLGNNLGALSFLIDMLNYQPVLAKKLFVYDDTKGELRPLMGRAAKVVDSAVAVPAQGPTLSQEMLAVFEGNGAGVTDEKLTFKLDALSTQAALAGQVELAKTAHDASMAVANNNPEATAIALGSLAVTLSPASGVPTSQVEVVDFEEDDLRDIFLEEAREVSAHGQQALEALANDPGDVGQMTVLRRVFHTLKGSSRMVGLNEFGEAAWSMEQLYNSWLADQKSASDEFRGLSVQALTGFARWIEDIAANHDGLWKASAFRSSADALRGEGELIPLALPAVAAADGTVSIPATALMPTTDAMPNLMEVTSTPVAEYFSTSAARPAGAGNALADTLVASSNTAEDSGRAADELMDFDVFFGIDQVSSEAASAVVAPVDAVVQPAVVAHDSMDGFEIQGIDFESLSALSGTHDAALTAEAAAEALEIEALQKQLDSFEIGAPVSDINLQAPAETVDLVELSAADFDAQFSPGLAVAAAESATDAPLAVQGLEIAEVHEAEAEEQVKIIGDLRIGIPLYNVYLNEADEWSRRLVTEVAEWAIERHQPVSDSTVSFAHSLAGSSATVGFASLSEMARALEHALQRSQVGFTDQAAKVHARVFVEAAEDIRRLLHQFAAGFLKESNAEVLALLRGLDFTTGAAPLPVEGDDFDFVSDHPKSALVELLEEQPLQMHDEPATEQTIKPYSEPHSQAHSGPYSAPQTDAEAMEMHPPADVEPLFSSAPVASYVKAVTPLAPVPVSFVPSPAYQAFVPAQPVTNAPYVNFVNDADDEFDAVDAIDLELFPIFEEEGAELMPQLGGALRQWSARPNNLSARMEVLRALHTLKGSARLAGAMRLGEMAHKIESEIEYLGSDSASSQEFEPLLARFDAMQTVFEGLRKADAAALVNANAGASVNVNAFLAEPVVADPAEFLTDAAAQLPQAGGLDSPVVTPLSGAGKVMIPAPQTMAMQPLRQAASASIRVRSQLLDRMVNQAGEVMITRSRLEVELNQLRSSLGDMTDNLNRLRLQLRDIELQAETQMQSRLAQAKELQAGFDPLEFDRFTRVQELTRMMAESVNDVATVQRTLQRTVEATEDDLIAQARQTRELQRDLLRTRMVEFEGISDRLYRVVRQASKETGKQVKLDLLGSTIEMDRGMLDRMTPAFEHLLRNCVAHGIENPDVRLQAGKEASGLITVHLRQEGNDVSVEFSDDGAGLDLQRIREKALSLGLVTGEQVVSDEDAANLIFMPGFSTAAEVTELSGRGIGMDVVRSEVNGVGGRIETTTARGKGTQFKLVLPLTTAVTQVVMVRSGSLSVGVPANVVETVRRTSAKDLQQAYNNGFLDVGGESVPFFWSGALLQASHHTTEVQAKTSPVVVFRSAAQRIALHVDEVLGNQEVVVKNLGPQLSRLPGLAGMSVLASGAVVLIYNPVALASIYGQAARALSADSAEPHVLEASGQEAPVQALLTPAVPQIPLIMVVDDSITVRRVTQRLLQREGYRVVLASDGLQALERLQEERPSVVLSDIEMPRMDGFDLARNIRADARLSDLPIVMITSRIAEKHRDHAKELGVDHYLGKPYAEDELMALVRHYCNTEALV